MASMVMSKLVVLSLLSFGMVWSARNYRALRHQRTINLGGVGARAADPPPPGLAAGVGVQPECRLI